MIFHCKFTENFCLVVTSAESPMSPICVASQVLRWREKQIHYVVQLRKYSQGNKVACVQYSFKVNVVYFNNNNKLSAGISCSAIKSKTSTNTHPRTLIEKL